MKDSLWTEGEIKPDTYVLFRGEFHLDHSGPVEIRTVGASWYQAWLDGRPLLEGPLRYVPSSPEYQSDIVELPAGDHVLAFHCHHLGVATRILQDIPPFLWCQVVQGAPMPVAWLCLPLASQRSETRRINPQLGWVEWRDTRLEPAGWESSSFIATGWRVPRSDASALPEPQPAELAPVATFSHAVVPMSEGDLATRFGYAPDEPSWAFHSRDRQCFDLPAAGVWRRYDLGRVRLGRMAITLDVPAGTVVEIASSEELIEDRVSPYINLSLGTSCNLDRYIARGGVQTFVPLTPKGGRFVEVHVVNTRSVAVLREEYFERAYHAPTEGRFSCGDVLLDRIWEVGVETYRSCAEDAVIDNPTRERGQWVGDVSSAGLEIAALAYHDLRLCRRALFQAACSAREDGLVAGLSPGTCIYLPTYSFQWAGAVLSYFRHTGDRSILLELWPYACRSMRAIEAFLHEDGLHNVAGWNFIDWGYQADEGEVDTASNLYYLWSLRAMADWAELVGQPREPWLRLETRLLSTLVPRIERMLAQGGWGRLGYHCAALALRLGLILDEEACLAYLEHHILDCFPNHPTAPRNDHPDVSSSRLITPYFAHYVMPLFLEKGRADFAFEQYRRCWGWMLQDGRTTWLEVFDNRWSHCHQWSGCPTWQLSRYVLGLHPRFDLGLGVFDFRLEAGSLPFAVGRLPHPAGGWIDIEWRRQAQGISYTLRSEDRLLLRFGDGRTVEIVGYYEEVLPSSPSTSPPPEESGERESELTAIES